MTQPDLSSQHNRLKIYLGSALLLLGMIVSTFVFSLAILACAVLPFKVRYNLAKCWAASVAKMAQVFCGIQYQIEGLEHIKPECAAVVLSNHQSAWETIVFRFILPSQISFFKKSLLWIPLWGWAMATLKPIAIDRSQKNAALRKLINDGTQALQQGLWVIVFPEGTRRPVGEMAAFNAGGAMLAQKSGCPVLPIAHDAGKCWPRYSFLKYPGTITVKIGPMIESAGRKASEINQQAEAWVANALQEMSE